MEDKKVVTRVILEMLGAPKDYIESTMKNYVAKLKKEGINILVEVYEEAIPQGKLFNTFAELEIKFNNLKQLLDFCFDAMPSSVEILDPIEFKINANEMSDFLNDLQARIHQSDMIVKTVNAQKTLLDRNALAVFQNFIIHQLKSEAKSIDELATPMGINPDDLNPFVERLIEQNKVKKVDNKFTLI